MHIMSSLRFFRVVSLCFCCLFYTVVVAQNSYYQGAIIRGDTSKKYIALVFTGHNYAEGGNSVLKSLEEAKVPASFFFTGDFYRDFKDLTKDIKKAGHYLGGHSDKHLLYCDWTNRDSLLVTKKEFLFDLRKNYRTMRKLGVRKFEAHYFMPPYEWYNATTAQWANSEGIQMVNFTSGTLSHADYTTPDMPNYRSSEIIIESIEQYHIQKGLNGFILLMHIGTDPLRTDKLYSYLPQILYNLKERGYEFKRIDDLLD